MLAVSLAAASAAAPVSAGDNAGSDAITPRGSSQDQTTGPPEVDFSENPGWWIEGICSVGDTLWVAFTAISTLNAYNRSTGERDPGSDVTVGHPPRGVWCDSETMWYTTRRDGGTIFAYDLATGARRQDRELDIRGLSFNSVGSVDSAGEVLTLAGAAGIASDGETMWVASDSRDAGNRLLALDMSTGEPKPESDIALGSFYPRGLYTDGEYLWVASMRSSTVRAYDISTLARAESLDLQATPTGTWGLWSDGEHMWVSDFWDTTVLAYPMPEAYGPRLGTLEVSGADLVHLTAREYRGRVARGTETVTVTAAPAVSTHVVTFGTADADDNADGHQWSLSPGDNTLEVTVSDGAASRTYTVVVTRVEADALSDDATLSALSVDGAAVDGFAADRFSYRLRVGTDVTSVTVAAAATQAAAQVSIAPADADPDVDGHQVSVTHGLNTVAVALAATDGLATATYTLVISRTPPAFAYDEFMDIVGFGHPRTLDMWVGAQTRWVSFSPRGYRAVLAYDASGGPPAGTSPGQRTHGRDITALAEGNDDPQALWSDDEVLSVLDTGTSQVFRYSIDADSAAGFGAHVGTVSLDGTDGSGTGGIGAGDARGLWSDGETMWVASADDARLYAYGTDSGTRIPSMDFDTLGAAGNSAPVDLWSDGAVMWVLDERDRKIYAYNLVSKERLEQFEFEALAPGNHSPSGLWSDGETMWVSDAESTRAYAYAMPAVPTLTPDTPEVPDDSDDLPDETTPVAPSGAFEWMRPLDYFNLGASQRRLEALWSDGVTIWASEPSDDFIDAYDFATGEFLGPQTFVSLHDAGNTWARGIWSDGDVMWIADYEDGKLYAYDLATRFRAAQEDIDTLRAAGNSAPRGIWSDGEVMWVADAEDLKLYAYALNGGARRPELDIDTLAAAGNIQPRDIWSDGETMWVSDSDDAKLYAYALVGGARRPGLDFDTLAAAGNTNPRGIWSNGDVMWVGDPNDQRLYAYAMPVSPAADQVQADTQQEASQEAQQESSQFHQSQQDDPQQSQAQQQSQQGDPQQAQSQASAGADTPPATELPAPPTGLSADASRDVVTLRWDDPGDDSITGYVILRRDKATQSVGTFSVVVVDTGTADTAYVDAYVERRHRYVYRVQAINAAGISERSSWARGFTPLWLFWPDLPAKPRGLAAEASHDQVTLSWDDPGDNSVTGYVILRRDKDVHDQGVFETLTADTGTTDTAYVDATAQPDRRYIYRVKAINTAGHGKTAWTRGWTPAAPPPASPAEDTEPDTDSAADAVDAADVDPPAEDTEPDTDPAADAVDAAEDTPAWSATMTAQWVYWGYGYYSTSAKQAGSLSPASFEVDGTTYTVNMIETRGWMYIGFDRQLPFGFVLELDGEQFASTDASFQSYSYSNLYQWRGTGLDWSDGDTVEVRLLASVDETSAGRATGAPVIRGTAQVGETLTADTSAIADPDGLHNAGFAYQWMSWSREIDGAGGSSLTLTPAERGRAIAVRVTFTDDAGNGESLTSELTAPVS